MSSQVDFYTLDSADEDSRLVMICRLANKVQRLGHRILVLTESEELSRKLDSKMWTWSQSSFLPHAMFSHQDPYCAQHPVLISQHTHDSHQEILINLKEKEAYIQGGYTRILEVVNGDETILRHSREKFRTYKTNNFNVVTHPATN